MFEDLNTFRDDEDGMDIDDMEDEVEEIDEPMLPVGAAGAVCARSISLSSLWPCASVISSAETDDLSICHRVSASSSSCEQTANQVGGRLASESPLPIASPVAPARYIPLDMVFPATRDQIITWHPNRVLFAIITLLFQRLSQNSPTRRRCRGKQSDPLLTLASWVTNRGFAASQKFLTAHRGAGRDMYRRIVSVLTATSNRSVARATRHLWQEISIESKNSWGQLATLFKHTEVQRCAPEFLPKADRHRNRTLSDRRAVVEDVDKLTCRGYGVSLCINTSLGQDDVQVIRILQTGVSGQELRKALAEVACYSKFIDACWVYFEALGKENGFPLVACGLEHSENASHPARVHVHVYMGMDIRGTFFANNAPMGSIELQKLIWNGVKPGCVRPTLVVRRTHSQIHKAVIQSYYYVAGPKKTQMLLRCSAKVHKEHGQLARDTFHIFMELFNAFRSNLVTFASVAIQMKKTRCVKDCRLLMVVWRFHTLLDSIFKVSCYLFLNRRFQFLLERFGQPGEHTKSATTKFARSSSGLVIGELFQLCKMWRS